MKPDAPVTSTRVPVRSAIGFPRRRTALAQRRQLLRVLVRVHRLPEPAVAIRVELAGGAERGQDVALEVLAGPVVERALVEREEPRVDVMVRQPRLLTEAAD